MSPELFDPLRLDKALLEGRAARLKRAAGRQAPARLAEKLAAFTGRRYCLLTASGRAAIGAGLAAMGAGKGARVGMTDITHPSALDETLAAGAKPEFLDIDLSNLNLAPAALEARAKKLDALIFTPMFSASAPAGLVRSLARAGGFPILEDASQAIGDSSGGRPYGAFGDISVFSLSSYKPVSAPGVKCGALLCDDAALFKKAAGRKIPPTLDPQYITLDITYRCPLSCAFCFLAKSSNARRAGREMTRTELGRLVDSLSGKPRKFYISGGEPLLRPDLPWLVKRIKAAGHYCRVITSLSHAPQTAVKLLASGLDELTVSVHGTPAIHDACVGRPGAFAAISAATADFNAARKGASRLVFWCTVNKANHAVLHSVYKALAALGPDAIAFHHLDFITPKDLAATAGIFRRELGCATALKTSPDMADGIAAGRLYAQILKIKAEKDPRVRFDLELSRGEMEKWYDPSAKLSKNGFCMSPWNGIWVDPAGDIVSCQPLGHKLGSALKGGCVKTFNGPAYSKFRKTLARHGGFLPTCSRCGRTAYMSGRRNTAERAA